MNTPNYQHLLKDLASASKRSRPKLNPDQKLSLCMIAKNEEEFIAGALQSARAVVDEIIVVDTGSTDRTAEIARANGAKVFSYEWQDDFGAARNESLKHATGDWVLIMDADERIPDDVADNIRVFLIPTELPIGYLITIKNYMSEKDPSHVLSHQMGRLFRKTRDTFFFGPIHEQVFPHTGEVVIPEATFFLEHFGYLKADTKTRKIEGRNIPLIRKSIEQTEKNNPGLYSFYCFYLGTSLSDPVEGNHWLRKSIENCPDLAIASHISVAYLDYLNNLHILKDYAEGVKIAEEALKRVPALATYPEFWDHYGMHLALLQRYDQALEKLHKAIAVQQNTDQDKIFNILREERIGHWGTLLNIGLVHKLKGDQAQAEKYFIESLEMYPKTDKQPMINRLYTIVGQDLDFLQRYYEQQLTAAAAQPTLEQITQLSNLYLRRENPVAALTLQHQIVEAPKVWKAALELLQVYRQSHRSDLVPQIYGLLVGWELPANYEWPETLTGLTQNEANMPEARAFFAQLLQKINLPLANLKNLTTFALQAQWYDIAHTSLRQLLAAEPKDYTAHLQLALVEQQTQHLPVAINVLQNLISEWPQRPEAYIQLANIYLAEGLFADAEQALRQALSHTSVTNSYLDYTLGIALMGQDKLSEAKIHLRQAQQSEPDNPSIAHLLNMLQQHQAEPT